MKVNKLNSRRVNSNPRFTSDAWSAIDASIDKILENNSDRNLSNVSIIGQALMASVAQYFDDTEDVMNALIDGIRSDNNVYWNSRSNNADIQVKTTEDKCISDWTPIVIKIAGVDYPAKGRVNIFYQSSANALRVADLEISWGSSSKLQKFLKSNGVNTFRNCETTLGISGYWGDGVKFNKEANQVFIDALSNGVLTFNTLDDFKKRKCNELNKYRFDKSSQRITTNSRIHRLNSRRYNSSIDYLPTNSTIQELYKEFVRHEYGWSNYGPSELGAFRSYAIVANKVGDEYHFREIGLDLESPTCKLYNVTSYDEGKSVDWTELVTGNKFTSLTNLLDDTEILVALKYTVFPESKSKEIKELLSKDSLFRKLTGSYTNIWYRNWLPIWLVGTKGYPTMAEFDKAIKDIVSERYH